MNHVLVAAVLATAAVVLAYFIKPRPENVRWYAWVVAWLIVFALAAIILAPAVALYAN
jgi:hypothetical protein